MQLCVIASKGRQRVDNSSNGKGLERKVKKRLNLGFKLLFLGTILPTPFHLPVHYSEFKPGMRCFSYAVSMTWLHLDGDLDEELVDSDGSRGWDFDDKRVVANTFGIMSRAKHEQLAKEGFYSRQSSSSRNHGGKQPDVLTTSVSEPPAGRKSPPQSRWMRKNPLF